MLWLFRGVSRSPVIALAVATVVGGTSASQWPCPTCTTLEDIVSQVKSQMPLEDSGLYVEPSQQVMEDWEQVVGDMMSGSWCDPSGLPSSLSSANYEVQVFADEDNNQDYCVLTPSGSVDSNSDGVTDYPWGVVIVNQANTGVVDISVDIPHPRQDTNTAEQGIAVFKGTNARSYVLSGSHRYANDVPSPCDLDYDIADAAHTINTFQSSVVAILEYYEITGTDHTAIQFHGMGSSTCPGVDAYISPGSNIMPGSNEKAGLLRAELNALTSGLVFTLPVVFTLPGEQPPCTLSGTKNVQGRLLNGVPADQVCMQPSSGYSGKFLHIEQKINLRAASSHQLWIDAINNVNFGSASPPTGFAVSAPNGGETWGLGTTVQVTWDSNGVDPAANVKLSVHLNDVDQTYIKTIANSVSNTGSYQWTIPGITATGNNFIVRVRSVDNTSIKDFSDWSFSIVNPIDVEAPDGGETWVRGTQVLVRWSAPGIGRKVKLSVHKGPGKSYTKTIKTATNNDGLYRWTVSNSLDVGSDYTVRVRSVDDTTIKAFSEGYFSIA